MTPCRVRCGQGARDSRTLIVSGGIEAVPVICRAREMGLHVVVSDMNPNAPGFTLADDRLLARTCDREATLAAARECHRSVRPPDGVMCVAADVPHTVACVAQALNLPGIRAAAARLAVNKLVISA